MILLVILVSAFLLSWIAGRLTGKWSLNYSGNLAVAIMLIFTGISHFIYTEGMILMLPHVVPAKKLVIYATGVLEILAAFGLLSPRHRKTTALLLMIFLIIILPANFKGAYDHLDLTTAQYDGRGPAYLWFRVPLQIGFIIWIWYFSFRQLPNEE
ncbi:hypothetical protein [Fulvivirga sedimenti]|uniref:DoxX family membrane protein n=1 Tax=Fulvivirga sedimenti TaxID=2879465 RepID=A0A9X1KUJ9_9BACT|nr:hypothetical protein [Fulvivirga sedimenti]MCA6073593.1 hypothetical protein [Fulvivirga sedimenti]